MLRQKLLASILTFGLAFRRITVVLVGTTGEPSSPCRDIYRGCTLPMAGLFQLSHDRLHNVELPSPISTRPPSQI